MQEDITNKTIALSIRTATFTARVLQKAIRAVLEQMKKDELEVAEKARKIVEEPRGKQTLRTLMGSKATLSNLEVMKEDLKPFQKVADRYGIDFAVTKEKGTSPPRYLVFFKGKDVDTITAAFQEYTRTKFGIDEKQSIKESLDTITREVKRKPPQRVQGKNKHRVKAHIPKLKPKVKIPEITR